MASRILLVDDELPVLNALTRALRREGCEILAAQSGEEALAILAETSVGVIICDHQMKGMSGAETLARSIRLCPDAVRITLTGVADLKIAQAAINFGRVSHFLLKPWDDDILRTVVREAVRHYEMEQEVRRLQELTRQQRDQLQAWNRQLEEKVRERTAELRAAYEETLDALVLALDSREHATAGHSRRVAVYCLYLALEVGVPADRLEDLHRGGLLHDIGKIGVPDAVLLKPGKLDPEERKIIEQHVVLGGCLLARIGYLKRAMAIPLYHHERYDGSGYSRGLGAEAIPIEARIFAVVDVYDALRSERPYKEANSHEQACEVIAAESGTHFDPHIASTFLRAASSQWRDLARAAEGVEHFGDALSACRAIQADGCSSHMATQSCVLTAQETAR